MSAVEEIAVVVSELRAHRAANLLTDDRQLFDLCLDVIDNPTVVDCTGIYKAVMAKDSGAGTYNYEDHPCIAPPWDEAIYCYVNQHGNVHAMHATVLRGDDMTRWDSMSGTHSIEWDRVGWTMRTVVWVGGHAGNGRPMPTSGPAHMFNFAIYEDGEPADLAWVHLQPAHPLDIWDIPQLVLLDALNFLNCRNVGLEDAAMPRPARRRLERAGAGDVKVQTINVYPAGKARSASTKGTPIGEDSPLSSVRGHFASYGPKYGKGLLFGKLEGRFFIPQHVRGSIERDEKPDYKLVP